MVQDTKEWRIPKKQLRCRICNKLITPIKGKDRKCCSQCKQDYLSLPKRKWVISQRLSKEQMIAYLQNRAKDRKLKYVV